jgi:cellulose biosynthesis protein BcsE
LKVFGIPGLQSSINTLLDGSNYAAIVDSVPARLSIIIQAIKSNLIEGNVCILLTPMAPELFLSKAEASGVNFYEDVKKNRLYIFSQEGEYTTNIFRLGVKRLLQEFEHFKVPKGCFYLFDQSSELFTFSDQNMAQAQALDYHDWMRFSNNTGLFLFTSPEKEKNLQAILENFSGIARVTQNRTGLELLIDFWYSTDGAIAAKAFPVLLDKTGFIRIEILTEENVVSIPVPETANICNEPLSDQDCIYFLGNDSLDFVTTINHQGEFKIAQNLVSLVQQSRESIKATVVISIDPHTDLKQVAETVYYMRLSRGNQLRIVIRESNFNLRFQNELFLLQVGANLIIHQQISRQRLPFLWDLLFGQIYTRKIADKFDSAFIGTLASKYMGYINLETFCRESLDMLARGASLDIPLILVACKYQDHISPLDVLSQIKISRYGDIFSFDDLHCYVLMHACAEEHFSNAFARITNNKTDELFSEINYLSKREHIFEAVQLIVSSTSFSTAIDFSEKISIAKLSNIEIEQNDAINELNSALNIPPPKTLSETIEAEGSELENLVKRLLLVIPAENDSVNRKSGL